jgi:hypothetical protein
MGKKVDRFLTIDDIEHTELSAERTTTRPAARFLMDQAFGVTDHGLLGEIHATESRKVFANIPNGVVRGSVIIDSPEGVFLPRTAHPSPREGFLGYMQSANEAFGSGIEFRDGERFLNDMPEYYIDDDVLFLTPDESNNFGMWILQVLPALIHAEVSGFSGILLCQLDLSWQQAFLQTFAPRVSQRLFRHSAGTAYRAKRMFVLAQDFRNFTTTKWENEVFSSLIQMAGGAEPSAKTTFISRQSHTHKNPMYRALLNEPELMEALRDYGVDVIEPEHLPLFDQIKLMASSRKLIGLGGANMFNAVFCRPGAKLVTIESSPGWISAHANLFGSAGIDYGVIFGRQLRHDLPPHQRWTLDVKSALSVILPFLQPNA